MLNFINDYTPDTIKMKQPNMLFLLHQSETEILNEIRKRCLSSEDHKEMYNDEGDHLLDSAEGISQLKKVYLSNPWSVIFFGMTKMLLDFASDFNGPFSYHSAFNYKYYDEEGEDKTSVFLIFNRYWDFIAVSFKSNLIFS